MNYTKGSQMFEIVIGFVVCVAIVTFVLDWFFKPWM